MTTSLWQLLGSYKVIIPIMQRDYAQGRTSEKVRKIRYHFLEAIFTALKSGTAPLELDFIYGYSERISGGKCSAEFIPLDGQQRLTTLFLLHWYVAAKEKHLIEANELLARFTYETRHSTRVFCEQLLAFEPEEFETDIKRTIMDQSWFFTSWKNDATIDSMLTMLNAIQKALKKYELENIWPLLVSDQPRIVFHLLPMEELGLPDELYIKMNSRGKELTEFESFKARFSEILNPEQADEFNRKIDQEWSDLFWNLFKDNKDNNIALKVDHGFLRFFRYITDILTAEEKISFESQPDEDNFFKEVYCSAENAKFLFSCLDNFCKVYNESPGFFTSLFYIDDNHFEESKTRVFFQDASEDLFRKCAEKYNTAPNANNPFSLGEQLMLYACIVHLRHNSADFNSRIRKIRNLIANSGDDVRKEHMPSLLATVEGIVLSNEIDTDTRFNKDQVKEEEQKQIFITENPGIKRDLYRLEDHELLRGCLAIFDLDNKLSQHADAFHKVFEAEDFDNIRLAMLTFGDYSRQDGWKWQFGYDNKSVWRDIFTPSKQRGGFPNTKKVLNALLASVNQSPQTSLENLVSEYVDAYESEPDKPKDWRYYFIKYPGFWHDNRRGYYFWRDDEKPYECINMRMTTFGGYYWDPFLLTLSFTSIDPDHQSICNLRHDPYDKPLIINKGNSTLSMYNTQEGFRFVASDDESKFWLEELRQQDKLTNENTVQINQTDDGVDLEDRVVKGRELINMIFSLGSPVAVESQLEEAE